MDYTFRVFRERRRLKRVMCAPVSRMTPSVSHSYNHGAILAHFKQEESPESLEYRAFRAFRNRIHIVAAASRMTDLRNGMRCAGDRNE